MDLSGLIQRQVELAGDLALGREQQIKADIQPGLGAAGDSVLLGRMAANLLTNGLNYSPHGAALTVRLYAGADGPVFEVENSGARIPDAVSYTRLDVYKRQAWYCPPAWWRFLR